GIGASRFSAGAQKYLKSGKKDQIQSFMAAAQGALESGSLSPADLSQALQSDEGFATALSRLSQAAEAAKASPADSAAQIRIAGINNRIAAIEAEAQRLQQFQPRSEFGIDALKTRMAFLDAELRSKLTERDQLVTPQINTFAQGTQNITERIDPSTGQPQRIGASELPVFIQQRGQDVRALIAERGREARAAAGRAQSESQFQRSQAAIESRFQRRPDEFERTMARAGIEPGSEEFIRAARIKARLERGAGSTLDDLLLALGRGGEDPDAPTASVSGAGSTVSPAGSTGQVSPAEPPRLERIVGPETAESLRQALAAMPNPAKQRQAGAVLRALAEGKITREDAISQLEVIEEEEVSPTGRIQPAE
ncbi:MAG: hypothetical protein L0312_13785, partial [Acidobacteria bacterium]|nr:hypothetical protein [Acidobacteriota bacterium]